MPSPVPIGIQNGNAHHGSSGSYPHQQSSFPRQQSWASKDYHPFPGSANSAVGALNIVGPSSGGWTPSSIGLAAGGNAGSAVGAGGSSPMGGIMIKNGGAAASTGNDGIWAPSGSWRGEGWQGLANGVPQSSSPGSHQLSASLSFSSFHSPLLSHAALSSSPVNSVSMMGVSPVSSYLHQNMQQQFQQQHQNINNSNTAWAGLGSVEHLNRLEHNFTKNFTCCGLQLKGLHDLLEHYEEAHVMVPGQSAAGLLPTPAMGMNKQPQLAHPRPTLPPTSASRSAPIPHPLSSSASTPSPATDSDAPHTPGMMDIEMDDATTILPNGAATSSSTHLPNYSMSSSQSLSQSQPTSQQQQQQLLQQQQLQQHLNSMNLGNVSPATFNAMMSSSAPSHLHHLGGHHAPSPWSSASALTPSQPTTVPQCVPPSLLTYSIPIPQRSTSSNNVNNSMTNSPASISSQISASSSSAGQTISASAPTTHSNNSLHSANYNSNSSSQYHSLRDSTITNTRDSMSTPTRAATMSSLSETLKKTKRSTVKDRSASGASGHDDESQPPTTASGKPSKNGKDDSTPSSTPNENSSSLNVNSFIGPNGERRFRCPVDGCGKIYKQQNGLKYHLQRSINSNHGHISPPASSQ